MKYYSFNEQAGDPLVDNQGVVLTWSEKEILDFYWPYWRSQMLKKYSLTEFCLNFTGDDCVREWVVTNWAWETDKDGNFTSTPASAT